MARRIGVRDLKAHLSRILKEVQAGESVLVTDRGRVVAELSRPTPVSVAGGPVAEALQRMVKAGHLRLAEPVVDPYPRSPLSLPEGTSTMLLAEERREE